MEAVAAINGGSKGVVFADPKDDPEKLARATSVAGGIRTPAPSAPSGERPGPPDPPVEPVGLSADRPGKP